MTPRLSNSKKWTAFPSEYLSQIESVFKEAFAADLVESSLKVEARIYPEEICIRAGVLPKGRLRQANFEASISYNPDANEAQTCIHKAIDAIASTMDEFFEKEDSEDHLELPTEWTAFRWEGKEIFMKFSTINSDLEAQADALLGLDTHDLVNETDLSDDAMDFAEKRLQ